MKQLIKKNCDVKFYTRAVLNIRPGTGACTSPIFNSAQENTRFNSQNGGVYSFLFKYSKYCIRFIQMLDLFYIALLFDC